VTVIATGFPTDMPKHSLFQVGQQSKLLEKTISSSTKEDINQEVNKETIKNTSEYLKKNDKIDDDLFIDDTDDWSTVPAFLRRKK